MRRIIVLLIISFVYIEILCQESSYSIHKNTDSSFSVDNNSSSLTYGIGFRIFFDKTMHNDFNWNFTTNLSIHLSEGFFIRAGLDLYDHHTDELKGILYLGPMYKLNLIERKIFFSLIFGIEGIAAAFKEGLGFSGGISVTPEFKYYLVPSISTRLQLRNGVYILAGYVFSPLVCIAIEF